MICSQIVVGVGGVPAHVPGDSSNLSQLNRVMNSHSVLWTRIRKLRRIMDNYRYGLTSTLELLLLVGQYYFSSVVHFTLMELISIVCIMHACQTKANTIVKARDSSLFQIVHKTHAAEVEIDTYHGYISTIFIRTSFWYFSCLFLIFSLNCSRKKILRRKNKIRDQFIFNLGTATSSSTVNHCAQMLCPRMQKQIR